MMALDGAKSALFGTLLLLSIVKLRSESKCPDLTENPLCPCFQFEDGIFLECPSVTVLALHSALKSISGPIQSLSIYELDKSVTTLSHDIFPNSTIIRHLKISQSNVRELQGDSLTLFRRELESFSLVSSKLQKIPETTFNGLDRLLAIDLEANEILDIPNYSFHDLHLIKLNLKGNKIEKVPENAFAGLESYLSELDLAENKIREFPTIALRRLDRLHVLRLAWNEIDATPSDRYSRLNSLVYLDLSSNNFQNLPRDCFNSCPSLKTLSLYYNYIENVHYETFISLPDLESLDLSHNKIVFLKSSTFSFNKKLRSIDLSHNHVHYITGLFDSLPHLKELFLSENNILEIPSNAFKDAVNLSVIYLQQNAISRIDPKALQTLSSLSQLHLSSNFVPYIPRDLFEQNLKLTSLSMDDNRITDLERGMFDKTPQLREIRLHNNRIGSITEGVFDPLSSLIELHLQNNLITSVDSEAFRTLESLQHINLQANAISELSEVFGPITASLTSIQLDFNGLTFLHNNTLQGQFNVRVIWLGHNKLQRLNSVQFRDLKQTERLYLENNSISDIEEKTFENMEALEFLDLSRNLLKEITPKTFYKLDVLEELNLSNNRIESIEPKALTYLRHLKTLDISNNPLKTLEEYTFQTNSNLKLLKISNCSLTNIHANTFKGLNGLNELNLIRNQLTSKDLLQLNIPELRTLKLSDNNLSDLLEKALIGLPLIETLLLDRCGIVNLPNYIFMTNTRLIKIDLSNNFIDELYPTLFYGLDNLLELKLCGNLFTELPYKALSNLSEIETISLSVNRLSSVDFSLFNGVANLKNLDFKSNKIQSLLGFEFSNLSQLVFVDLSDNNLFSLPENLFLNSPIQQIDLSRNKFRQVPFSNLLANSLISLNWLNLTENPLLGIYTEGSSNTYHLLEEIHISSTNLTIITSKDFDQFPSLLHLYLNRNTIVRISPGAFRIMAHLQTLDLSINELELLPQERLDGLNELRLLNLTRNKLTNLESFSDDLKSLQVLDLSFNQIERISKGVFRHLANLAELYLRGNWISTVSGEAFLLTKKMRTLDLSRNYLENIPLDAFRSLETLIKSLRVEENPLTCNCDAEEVWEWLHDHEKLAKISFTSLLQCELPSVLKGRQFLELEPEQFCDEPLIVKIGIQDIQPFSVHVSWQSRNHSGLHGFRVIYYSLEITDEIRGKMLDRNVRSTKLSKLNHGMRYLICILALGNWDSRGNGKIRRRLYHEENDTIFNGVEILSEAMLPLLKDSPTSKCTEVTTLRMPDSGLHSELGSETGTASILTRRLGLIVGCCLGFVVFIALVSVLGYLKVKKQRATEKRDQPMPQECIMYRHFSVHSDAGTQSDHPQFITDMNNTN